MNVDLIRKAVRLKLFVKSVPEARKHSEKGPLNTGAIFNTSSKEKLAADVSTVVYDMFSNEAV